MKKNPGRKYARLSKPKPPPFRPTASAIAKGRTLDPDKVKVVREGIKNEKKTD